MVIGTGSLEIKQDYKTYIAVDPYYGLKNVTVEAYLDKNGNIGAYQEEMSIEEAASYNYRLAKHTLMKKCDSNITKKLTCCVSQHDQTLVESATAGFTFTWKIDSKKVLVDADGFVVGVEGDDFSSLLVAPTLTENIKSNKATGEVPACRIILENYGLSDMIVTCEVNSL